MSEQKLNAVRTLMDEHGPYIATQFYTKLFESKTVDADAVAYALDHAVATLIHLGA
jgi:uncharacterized membrane protein YhfC